MIAVDAPVLVELLVDGPRAGEMQRRQRQRAGDPRAIADFLVGAHALLQCDALITFDAAFHRDYFKGLKLIQPKA